MKKDIYIGFDHRGVKLADKLIKELEKQGFFVQTPFKENKADDDYNDIAAVVCENVNANSNSIGVLICGTGIGMCMSANKNKGIRAVLAETVADAYFARRHEDSNVIVLAAGYTDNVYKVKSCPRLALKMVNVFVETPFEAGRHISRVEKLNR